MKLRKGDAIRSIVAAEQGATREVTLVRRTGYQWKYRTFGEKMPSGHLNSFASEDSNDPFFDGGWFIVRDLTRES